jgi:predicted Rdx family selenoprotein
VETKLTPGGRGEFTVWVNGQKIAEKDSSGFPPEKEVVAKVGAALGK